MHRFPFYTNNICIYYTNNIYTILYFIYYTILAVGNISASSKLQFNSDNKHNILGEKSPSISYEISMKNPMLVSYTYIRVESIIQLATFSDNIGYRS